MSSQGVLGGIKFIDLFAGIGGFHTAMESLGAQCVFASEWDKHASAVYKKNYGLAPAGDITKIEATDIPAHSMICGGFPCQAFSISGKRLGFADTRGTLFFDVARIAKEHKPAVLFLENVQNFAKHDHGRTLKTVRSVLEELGYVVFDQVLNAAEYGFATARKRIYIVAFRKDLGVDASHFSFPVPVGVSGALKDHLQKGDQSACELKKPAKLDPLMDKKAIAEARKSRPTSPIRIGTVNKGAQGDRVYSPEGPAITLSAYGGGNASKTGAYLIGGKVRKLTPKECASVMGFPKTFKMDANPNQAYKQFGNSVVVGVIRLIGLAIAKALESAKVKKETLG